MATIPGFDPITATPANTDLFWIDFGSVSKKITIQELRGSLLANDKDLDFDGAIYTNTGVVYIENNNDDKDIIIRQTISASPVNVLEFDALNGGQATFIAGVDCAGYFASDDGVSRGHIGLSGTDYVIEHTTLDKDIIIKINDGGVVKDAISIIGSTSLVKILSALEITDGLLTFSAGGSDGYIQQNGNNFEIINANVSGDIIFTVSDGVNPTKTSLQIITGTGDIKINDGQKMIFGDNNDGQIYESSGSIYIDNVTVDGDFYIRVNDGGVTKDAIFIDGSDSGRVTIPYGIMTNLQIAGITNTTVGDTLLFDNGVGTGFEFEGILYVDDTANGYRSLKIEANTTTNDIYIDHIIDDKDIYIRAKDSSTLKTFIHIDGSESIVRIPDTLKLTFGTGDDGQIYSSSDDIYIDNVTGDKDIYIRAKDNTTQYNAIKIDASERLIEFSCIQKITKTLTFSGASLNAYVEISVSDLQTAFGVTDPLIVEKTFLLGWGFPSFTGSYIELGLGLKSNTATKPLGSIFKYDTTIVHRIYFTRDIYTSSSPAYTVDLIFYRYR